MTFKDEIKDYEFSNSPYIIKMGLTPIIIVTPKINKNESFAKTIAKYVSNKTESSFLINIQEQTLDDNFKPILLNLINNQNIKLLISITIDTKDNGFDLEIETSKNLNAIFPVIKQLETSFKNNHVKTIYNKNYHEEFKYNSVDIIQIIINPKYLYVDNLENICNALINFINQYLTN